MNKLIQRQLQKYFGKEEQVPENFTRLLNVISDSYDHYEKDRKLIERSIELSSKEMIELNSQIKKSGKDELEKVHNQLKMLFENIEEIFYSVDVVKLSIIQISAACEKVYGYTQAEFLADRDLWQKVILPEDIDMVFDHFKELYAGKPVLVHYRILHRDKSIRWLESKIIPSLDEAGQLMRLDGVTNDITERKQAEDQVRDSELRYRSLFEQASIAIGITDSSMKFYDMNPNGCKMLGYSKEEFLKLSIADLFFTEDLKANPLKIEDLQAGKTIRGERRFKRKDGTIIVVDLSGKLMNDGRFIMFGRDVSDRKESEKIIKESEFRYRSLVEQATDAISMADASMKFIDINPYACQILGYSEAEALQLSVPDVLFAEDLTTNPFKLEELRSGEIIRNERRFKRKDGSSVILEVSTRLLEDGRFIMFGHDISERKQAEKLVKESELRYRSLIEQATDAICIADSTLQFIDMNPYACGFLGYTREEALQLFVPDILFPEDMVTDPINKFDTIKVNEIIRNERRFKRKDGSSVIMEISTKLMEDGRFIMFGHDVSERKKAEEKIRRSEASLDLKNKELELKNKELEHFAYVASHDLQEPLRTTSSFVNLLKQQYKGRLDEKADKYLHYIADSTERMKILITDLLEYSRIGNNKELQQVDCNTVLNELLQDLDTTLKETGAKIKVDPLPVISGYQTELKQLFLNLVVNAIKFRKKDIIPQIRISACKDNAYWTFSIQDNGIGIPEDHIDRIFVIFQRLHTRTEYEGSGIGLAHCKKIVGLHGGNIWVESKPNEGATFYFTIPLNQ